jgi:hypothetical protein
MAEIHDLSATDASNIARWPENMPFSGVNDAGRADEGMLARWYKDTDSSITASGSANAFAITSNRTIAALFNNLVMCFTANFSITGATTLNLNGLGAKSLKRFNGDALAQGDIISGQPVTAIYKSSGDQWFMLSALAANTGNMFFDLNENATPGTPATAVGRLSTFDDSGTTRLRLTDDAAATQTFYPAATAAEMEAQTANRLVSADLQHRHPMHPKAWAKTDQTGTQALDASAGMSSVTDGGTGLSTFTLTTAMSSANFGAFSTCQATASGSNARQWMSFPGTTPPTTTTITLLSCHNGSNAVDSPYVTCLAVGDQ